MPSPSEPIERESYELAFVYFVLCDCAVAFCAGPFRREGGRGQVSCDERQREIRFWPRCTRGARQAREYSGCELARLFREWVAKTGRHDGDGEGRQSSDRAVLYRWRGAGRHADCKD